MQTSGRMVDFQIEGQMVRGYFSVPQGSGPFPGLMIIHEWWGLNDHIKDIVGRFANEGYVALAPDLYDGRVTTDPDRAAEYMQGLDQARAIKILNGAVAFLQSEASVLAEKIGVTGFCMGGSFALLLPCLNKRIKAAAPFYGDVPSDDVLKNLSAPILFIGAENDFWITRDKIDRLKRGLKKYSKEGDIKVYPRVGHAFVNETRPEAYDRESAEDAWLSVNEFFERELK